MSESFNQTYGYARAIWRRRWLAVSIAWGTCAVIWAVTLTLQDRYEAMARVYVDARTPLRPVLEGIAIQEDYDSQLSLVREALLSRPQLEAVAHKTKLDAGATSPQAREAVVSVLQKQLTITSTSPSRPDGGPARDTVYEVTYQHSDRAKSIEVVQTLIDNFVEGTLTGNRLGASEAQNFLSAQIKELEQRLADAEARLADFKKRNVGMLPGERGDYFSRLETEMTGLQQVETNLAIASSRREALRRQLASARLYVPGTSGAQGVAGVNASSDISVRVQESEARLEELLLRFTEKHPEVVALRGTIAELKVREAKELSDLAKGGSGTGAIRSLNVNPVYQSIQVQLNQAEVELASLRGAAAQHRSEIANLRRFVDSAPEVEQEFARLNRDYGVTKTQYETLVERLEKARVSDDAVQSGIVRFEVIEPPRADAKPVWPNRALLVVIGLLVGIGAGLASALIPHFASPVFGDTATLERKTGLPVLGAVSAVRSAGDAVAAHLESRRLAIACGSLIVVCIALSAFGGPAVRLIRNLAA